MAADAGRCGSRARLASSGCAPCALFPAMHRYRLDDEAVATGVRGRRSAWRGRVRALRSAVGRASGRSLVCRRRSIFGSAIRWRSRAVALRFPVGAGRSSRTSAPACFREALMAADQCPNIHLDTSSSNSWMKYHPGLTLEAVFRQALAVVGPDRLLFGTDSSFFPRGWQKPVYDAQVAALDAIGVTRDDRAKILGGNFERLFPDAVGAASQRSPRSLSVATLTARRGMRPAAAFGAAGDARRDERKGRDG